MSESLRSLISTGWNTIVAEPTQTLVEKEVAAIKWLRDPELSIPRSGFDACYTFLDPYISPVREGVGGIFDPSLAPSGQGGGREGNCCFLEPTPLDNFGKLFENVGVTTSLKVYRHINGHSD